MKKILSLILVALTLCVQHESYSMGNLRNYVGRLGQQCTRLYTQGAQQVVPAYRSFTTGARQQLNNIRPQISQQFRNMQSSARNWSQNLNLPTARTTALGLGGTGLGATYLKRPDIFGVAGAEEEIPAPEKLIKHVNTQFTYSHAPLEGPAGPIGGPSKKEEKSPSDILNNIKAEFDEITHRSHSEKEILSLKTKLEILALNSPIYDRKTFASMVNELLSELKEYDDLYDTLKQDIQDSGSIKTGALIFLAQAINGDITLINAVDDLADVPDSGDPTVKLVIPTVYAGFFHHIGKKDPEAKKALIEAINILDEPTPLHEAVENDNSNISEDAKILRASRRFQNKHKLLNQITNKIEQKEDLWWWPFS